MTGQAPVGRALTWTDLDDLVVALRRTYPEVDPRGESFDALRHYVVSLPSFAGTPDDGDLGTLEVIRSLWWWGASTTG